jgi:CBS-domain-containing membrane protein
MTVAGAAWNKAFLPATVLTSGGASSSPLAQPQSVLGGGT